MRRIAVFVVTLVAAVSSYAQCNTPPFPTPKVQYLGMIPEPQANRYFFTVTNYGDYSDALFVKSPALPPCGLNTEASRTWLNIYRANNVRIYGYCAFHDNSRMANVSFAVKKTDPQPRAFYIRLTDRKCKRVVTSGVVGIPGG